MTTKIDFQKFLPVLKRKIDEEGYIRISACIPRSSYQELKDVSNMLGVTISKAVAIGVLWLLESVGKPEAPPETPSQAGIPQVEKLVPIDWRAILNEAGVNYTNAKVETISENYAVVILSPGNRKVEVSNNMIRFENGGTKIKTDSGEWIWQKEEVAPPLEKPKFRYTPDFFKNWATDTLEKLLKQNIEPEMREAIEKVIEERKQAQRYVYSPTENPPEPPIETEEPPIEPVAEETPTEDEKTQIDLSPSGKTDAEIISVFKKALDHASDQYPNKILPDLVTTFFVIDGIQKALEELFNSKCEDITVYEWISEFYKRRWIKPPSDVSEPINWRSIPMIEILIKDPDG